MQMNARLVIFDCDGVLVDSEFIGNVVFAELLSRNGYEIGGAETARRFRGMKLADCLEILERESAIKLPATFISDFRQASRLRFEAELQPVAGIVSLIESMEAPFCVASSGPRSKITDNLRFTGLYSHFRDAIFSSYDVETWKPDPGLFLHVARHYGFAPENCVVVEDSAPGVSAGIAAGMRVLALGSLETTELFPRSTQVFGSIERIHDYLASLHLARPRVME